MKKKSTTSKASRVLFGVLMLVAPVFAMAQATQAPNDLNGIFTNIINLAQTGKLLLLAVFYLGGLGLAGYGAWTIYKALKPNSQESFGLGSGMFVVGVVLCILPSMIGLTANTAIGGDGQTQTSNAITTAPSFGGTGIQGGN